MRSAPATSARPTGECQKVEAGQRLAVVEAMKMTTPFAGVVADLVANIGGQVEVRRRITRVEAGEAVEAKA
jgi:biotin carboxyl carrier protein